METAQRNANIETENAKSKIAKNNIDDRKLSQVNDYLQKQINLKNEHESPRF